MAHTQKIYHGKINIFFPWELPDKIDGLAVMIDVVASSHNIVNLIERVDQLYTVTLDNVHFALKEIPDAELVGESDDPPLKDKFAVSNRATDVAKADLGGKKVILITSNGTHTLSELWDKGARPIIVASYTNLHTVVRWLHKQQDTAKIITLVPSGGREAIFAQNPNLHEDLLCAKAIKNLLRGKIPNFQNDFAEARKFIDKHYPHIWPTKEADLALIFTSHDTNTGVPICERLSNGLLKVIPASYDDK